MRPDGVDDKRKKGEPSEEDHTLGQGYVSAELCPVGEGYPPHVIGEHHAAVECMDHHPLISSPKQGARPASLSSMRRKDEVIFLSRVYVFVCVWGELFKVYNSFTFIS